MTPREVLLGAAQVLEARGWCQGAYLIGGDNGRVCLAGALKVGMGLHPHDHPPEESRRLFLDCLAAVHDLIREPMSVTTWNDTEGRTANEVIAILERAAEAAA